MWRSRARASSGASLWRRTSSKSCRRLAGFIRTRLPAPALRQCSGCGAATARRSARGYQEIKLARGAGKVERAKEQSANEALAGAALDISLEELRAQHLTQLLDQIVTPAVARFQPFRQQLGQAIVAAGVKL